MAFFPRGGGVPQLRYMEDTRGIGGPLDKFERKTLFKLGPEDIKSFGRDRRNLVRILKATGAKGPARAPQF